MSKQKEPTKDKPYFSGPETFETMAEAVEYADENGYANVGYEFDSHNSWCGPKDKVRTLKAKE